MRKDFFQMSPALECRRVCGLLTLLFAAASCTSGGAAVPSPPSGVQAQVQAGVLHLTWSAVGGGQTEFVIGRAVVGAAASRPAQTELQVVGSTAGGERSYDDLDVAPGHFYFYAVAARSAAGRSGFTLQDGDALSLTPMSGACAGTITATDSDGDGLSDADELAGWTVLVDEDGTGTNLSSRTVHSDPFNPDTDGDGLCDAQESQLKTDPTQADTDGDGLSDYDEVNRWGSSPTNVDSDGDAHGNPAFYDGAELLNFGTSPTLADTDGDGRSDYDEVNQNGTNPLVAELPQPRLNVVSAMDLGVNVQLANGTTVTDAATHTFTQGTTSLLTQTSASADTASIEASYSVSAEASAGFPESAGVKVTGTASQKEGYVQETSTSFSRASELSASAAYDQLASDLVSKDETVTGGHIGLDFEIVNAGTRSFQLSSVVVTALRRDPANPGAFTSIATLTFPSTADNLVLAEGQTTGPIRAQADIAANTALDLLANPGDVFFQTANFSLTDRTGTSFAFSVGETTASRTALLTLDYGGVRPLERYRVATNVERTSTGKAAGVRLGDVLQRILGLAPAVGYQTEARAGGGKRIFTRVRDVAAVQGADGGTERFWVLLAPENPDPSLVSVSDRLLSSSIDVEDAVLMPRDSLTLAFVADHDGDGLFEREEALYGTFDGVADSDGDGLTDFEEVRVGWTVNVDNAFYRAHPHVYSNPTAVDADGDGWDDATERAHGTDPNRKDTDGDGIIDSLDPEPTQGPSGAWVKVLGTAGDEAVLQVLADSSTVWVLGTSTGDIDQDGVPGGPFLMALEPASGAVRWTLQLEGSQDYARKVVLAPDGTVTWIAEVLPGGLPGVTLDALYLVHLDSTGRVLGASSLTDVPYTGATALGNTTAGTEEPAPGGGVVLFAGYRQLNNLAALQLTGFSAGGAFVEGVGLQGSYGTTIPQVRGSATAGLLTAVSVDWTAGCSVQLFRATAPQGGGAAYCTTGNPGRVGVVALDSQSAAYVAVNTGAQDQVDRITLAGLRLWSRTYAGELTAPRVTALDVDASDQIYLGLTDSGKPAALDIIEPSGQRLALLRLGNPSTQLVSSRRDGVGNLFLVGTTLGGFETYAPNLGGTDVVVTRNPQLTFGP
jgi:Bacterial TSP3 repeat